MAKKIASAVWRRARRYPKTSIGLGVLLLVWLFCLPRPLFDQPYSGVLEDRRGELLGARIASDGQWRFPPADSVPEKYAKALVTFEDKRFWYHPGVDPMGFSRAIWQNITQGRVVSGGSTITMQVIRMARHNPGRNIWQKLVELFMATRLELSYSKKEILALYAGHAPFGGNVVGLEAASWRYYGKKPGLLTWAEAATLAVLPNSPALIHPGRRRDALLEKRNRLLEKMLAEGEITAMECDLAKSEPLPDQPVALPNDAPHLLDSPFRPAQRQVSIDAQLQRRVAAILSRRQEQYRGNLIYNMAAVVIDVPTGEVLAYVGNVTGAGAEHGEFVDMIRAPRSTGSILKPYLFALSLESGDMLPNSLLHDVPTQLGQYKPENFYETYDGAVPARRALVRSLNVPFVLLLQQHGLEKCHFEFKKLGLSTLRFQPAHYGLSLILGGAEANLLDITNIYAGMSRRLGKFYDRNGKVADDDFRQPAFTVQPPRRSERLTKSAELLSAGSIWHTFEAMQEVERPNSSGEWELFQGSRRMAWKTGTSFGFRDAWAAGANPRYAVGVWVGNADGEGRPGLLGVEMAAPILFEIVGQLPNNGPSWFDPPYDDMVQIPVCRQSGYRANEYCQADTIWVQKNGLNVPACDYHQLLHLDATGQWQVNSNCEQPSAMQHKTWFVLDPLEEFYFKSKNPSYQSPPPFRPDCIQALSEEQQIPMRLIYPKEPTRIYVPVDLDGKLGATVFRVAHRMREAEVFWHLDGAFIGSTQTFHQMSLQPGLGKHTLALVDKAGYRLEQVFEIVGKER